MTAILLQNDLNIKDTNPQIAEQTDMSKTEPKFGKLLDSKIKTSGDKNISTPKTLGDIKTKTQSVDDGLSRFKEILMKAAGEINVENSLDLTLGKDIGKMSLLYAGFGATIGHDFPFWMKFRGGKGVASSSVAFVIFDPLPTLSSTAWLLPGSCRLRAGG